MLCLHVEPKLLDCWVWEAGAGDHCRDKCFSYTPSITLNTEYKRIRFLTRSHTRFAESKVASQCSLHSGKSNMPLPKYGNRHWSLFFSKTKHLVPGQIFNMLCWSQYTTHYCYFLQKKSVADVYMLSNSRPTNQNAPGISPVTVSLKKKN